ncbi:IS200/IS605 family transposase [Priestia megaterium]|uniref:IS200/IS605 family transposase n=1 Tax=Priestia megaterium TaxID=1404 RepID=A0A6M6E9R0_PRIMG|nr:IS200/IS605 family transposase [Priestia megaterium]QJX80325.1 IS200/IS605 family transposase [Priestia megaterium]
MEYTSKNHSKFLLMAHLIFVCKYRKPLLVALGNDVKSLISSIAKKYSFKIIEMEVDKDHIHLLLSYEPKMSILEVVRLLKQITTYHLWKERTFWSDGYFACSVGNASKEIIQAYIQNQG